MCHAFLTDSRFYRFLFELDQDIARQVQADGCACGGVLHSARYPRKPRGLRSPLEESYTIRLSFCCAEDGCRRRSTPPSVRFLGRKVTLGVIVILVTALESGLSPRRRKRFIDQLRQELVERTYRPQRLRKVAIPKDGGGSRGLSIPTIRDRVVQGALKLILEPIFEADFQPGSFGYRPKRSAHDAIERVSNAIAQGKTYVIDLDLRAYFDTVSHSLLLDKVAQRVDDDAILRLLKLMLKASGKRGVAQGGVISPLLSNLFLTEVDKMLERMKRITAHGSWTALEWTRFADDRVVLVDGHPRQRGLCSAVEQRLRRELAKLRLEVNEDKTRRVDLTQGQCFAFLGFLFRRIRSRHGRWMPLRIPQIKKRTALLRKLKVIFRRFVSQPVEWVISLINPTRARRRKLRIQTRVHLVDYRASPRPYRAKIRWTRTW